MKTSDRDDLLTLQAIGFWVTIIPALIAFWVLCFWVCLKVQQKESQEMHQRGDSVAEGDDE